ncbi:hypothetical protein V6N13_003386 [Hibiscus sabdariffa]
MGHYRREFVNSGDEHAKTLGKEVAATIIDDEFWEEVFLSKVLVTGNRGFLLSLFSITLLFATTNYRH